MGMAPEESKSQALLLGGPDRRGPGAAAARRTPSDAGGGLADDPPLPHDHDPVVMSGFLDVGVSHGRCASMTETGTAKPAAPVPAPDPGRGPGDIATLDQADWWGSEGALTETFVKERPLVAASSGLAASAGDGPDGRATGPVTVDDAALLTARLDGGAVATYEATRFAAGHKNGL